MNFLFKSAPWDDPLNLRTKFDSDGRPNCAPISFSNSLYDAKLGLTSVSSQWIEK
jgi:hypothetical protein